jgi:hypothetical protein
MSPCASSADGVRRPTSTPNPALQQTAGYESFFLTPAHRWPAAAERETVMFGKLCRWSFAGRRFFDEAINEQFAAPGGVLLPAVGVALVEAFGEQISMLLAAQTSEQLVDCRQALCVG